ncbi:MAG TPA: tRNA lysidine(34) synthetase TilS [Elusimicrobia bacterium]|nr:tRNA lysidine(34) synthetase TilS [Elusimicrobiota bacterium]
MLSRRTGLHTHSFQWVRIPCARLHRLNRFFIMLQNIKRFIDKYKLIKKNDRILIAISGGPDSIFLLRILVQLRNLYRIKLYGCHIDHQYRKKSWKDALFVKNICKELSIPVAVEKIKLKRFSEEQARNIRYKIFEEIAGKFNCSKIATGHTLDDNAETVLMWIIRGCGLKGLSGIPPKRGRIIRPILCISKNEILNYLNSYKLRFCKDKTNLFTKFTRNKIRLNVLPRMEEINPKVKKNIFVLSEILRNNYASKLSVGRVDTFKKKYYNSVNYNFKEKTVFFDVDKLDIKKINKRNWKNGDKMVPFGMTKAKKLQDIFVDEKIPKEIRKKIPIISVGNNIIWVAGVKRSNDAMITENTKRIMRLELCN